MTDPTPTIPTRDSDRYHVMGAHLVEAFKQAKAISDENPGKTHLVEKIREALDLLQEVKP